MGEGLSRPGDEGVRAARPCEVMAAGQAASDGQPTFADVNRLAEREGKGRGHGDANGIWPRHAGGDGWGDVGKAIAGFARRGRVLAEAGAVARAARAIGAALVAVVLLVAAGVFVHSRLPRVQQ